MIWLISAFVTVLVLALVFAFNFGGRGVFRFWLVLLGLGVTSLLLSAVFGGLDLAAYLAMFGAFAFTGASVAVFIGYMAIALSNNLPHLRAKSKSS